MPRVVPLWPGRFNLVPDEPDSPAEQRRPAEADAPAGRRHLAFHLLPVAGNGVWQTRIDELRQHWPLFDGTRAVAVATGGPVRSQTDGRPLPLDPPDAVRKYLPPGCVVEEFANDPAKWESASWDWRWGRVLADASDGDAILHWHAKGVTRGPGLCDEWAAWVARVCLERWPACEAALRTRPVAGALLKRGRFFGGSLAGSEFHFSGNGWWARAGAARERLSRVPVPDDPWGTEAWVGLAFAPDEAAGVGPDMPGDAYRPETWAALRPPLERWCRPVRLSVAVPVGPGHAGIVGRALASINGQLRPGDEIIVRHDASGDWGMTPREAAIRRATGTHLLFMDADDVYLPGALDAIRRAAAEFPGRPLMFGMLRGAPFNDALPKRRVVEVGNVSTQMICVPNDPHRLGKWGARYEGDYDFVASTLALYPADALVWRDDVIATWRPV